MDRKIIFFDLDGTLMTGFNSYLPTVPIMLKSLCERGHIPIICTGRGRGRIPKELKENCAGVIALSGTLIEFSGRVLFNNPLEPKTVKAIMRRIYKNMIPSYIEADEHFFSYCFPSPYPETADVPLCYISGEVNDLEQARKLIQKYEIYKISVVGEHGGELSSAVRRGAKVQISDNGVGGLELMNLGIDKGTAVKTVLRAAGLSKEDAVCFGDGANDIPMFEECGFCVAMGNADDRLKPKADAITTAAALDGCGLQLRKLRLI